MVIILSAAEFVYLYKKVSSIYVLQQVSGEEKRWGSLDLI